MSGRAADLVTEQCSEGGTTGVLSYRRLVGRKPKRFWRVRCSCGFTVYDLDTEEAADDTRRWHLGLPSLLGAAEERVIVLMEALERSVREAREARDRRVEADRKRKDCGCG